VPAGYKQTEVGIIPEEWVVKQIGDFEPFVTSGSRGWAVFYSERGSPFIRITNLSRTCIYPDLHDLRFVKLAANHSEAARTQLLDGDVLISITADIGIVGHVTANVPKPAYINQHIALVRFDSARINSRFVSYFLASEKPQKLFCSLTDSGAKAGMNLTTVQQIRIALPPTKAEQEAIAEALSDADALIESLEQLLAKKRQLKQGAMQELLTGKKRLPGFSGKWEVKRLGDVVDTDPENLGSDTNPDLVFNYIALEDVDRGFLRSHSEQLFANAPSRARRKLRLDDVLVSTVRPNLQSHLLFRREGGNWVCSTGFCVVRCRKGVTHPGYVFFHLFANCVNRQIEALLTGSNYPAINSGDVRALEIPFPAYTEQAAIAAILSDMDAGIAALEAKLAKAHQLKQGMMQELLTGRVRLIN
jgi:type I restriction enzyme S subunit